MVSFISAIKKFDDKGEKTGWTYIEIPAGIAVQLNPDTKVSFLVKGKLDEVAVKGMSLLPMGGGNFILPLKSDLRKKLRKSKGAMLKVTLEKDNAPYAINKDFLQCLEDTPDAASHFRNLPGSHQKYFSKWIESAKTDATKAKRIAQAVEAMQHHLSYAEMMRKGKEDRDLLEGL